jgi:Tfp pilus assembly protein PilF
MSTPSTVIARTLRMAGYVLALLSVCVAHAASPTTTSTKAKSASPAQLAEQITVQTEAAFILHHDHVKAEQGFLHATRVAPGYAPAWFNLGVLAEGDKAWPKATSYFQHYLNLQPTGPDADRARGQLQLLAKYQDGSITPGVAQEMEYDEAIQRARVFLAHGYFRAAITEAGHAQALDGSRWEAYAVVSLCMARQGKWDDAEEFTEKAVSRAPFDKQAQLRIALTPTSRGYRHFSWNYTSDPNGQPRRDWYEDSDGGWWEVYTNGTKSHFTVVSYAYFMDGIRGKLLEKDDSSLYVYVPDELHSGTWLISWLADQHQRTMLRLGQITVYESTPASQISQNK